MVSHSNNNNNNNNNNNHHHHHHYHSDLHHHNNKTSLHLKIFSRNISQFTNVKKPLQDFNMQLVVVIR